MLSRAWERDRASLGVKVLPFMPLRFATPADWREKTRVRESVLPQPRRFPHNLDAYRIPDSEDSLCRASPPERFHRLRTSYAPLAAVVRRSVCPGIAGESPAAAARGPNHSARRPRR